MTKTKGQIEKWQTEDAARLKALFENRQPKMSQLKFGSEFGIGNQAMVGQYLNGARPLNIKAATAFATGLNVAIEEFSPIIAGQIHAASKLSAKNTEYLSPSIEGEFTLIKRANVKFSAGKGKIVFLEGEKSRLSFRSDFLRAEGLSEKSAVIVYADGCSMEPQIPDASVLLVNTASKNILRDKTYAFRSGDMLLVKKLRREKDGRIRAISNNPDKLKYPDLFYGLEDHSDFEMIGRVFWMGTRI